MKSSALKALLLKLSLLVAITAALPTDDNHSPTTSLTNAITNFVTWPIHALSGSSSNDNHDKSSYPRPFLTQKLYHRSVYNRSLRSSNNDIEDESSSSSLFSFKLTGTVARKHQQRIQRELNGVGSNFYDGPVPVNNPTNGHGCRKLNGVGSVFYDGPVPVDTVLCDETHDDGASHGSENHVTGSHSDALHGEEDGHDSHNAAHDMVVHVTYEDIYSILVFLIVATAFGILTSKLGMPALVGEIITGFLLGPPLADFVPYPEAMVLVGEIGLILLLLEAGVELDIAQLKATGTRAVGIGLTGTILPLVVGMGLATANGASIKSAMAVGASFSPTSLGVAASALRAGKAIDKPVGQLIVAACVVDDILALILLSMFKVLVMDSPPIIQYFIPIISSLGFLFVLGVPAVTWMPKLIETKILNKFKNDGDRQLVMFSMMACLMMAYLPLLNYTKASYLTGAFLAGLTFSQVEHCHHQFTENMHHVMTWLIRVFFSASIGFQVPVKQFSDPYVIGWGFIFYLCVIAKLPLMFYCPRFEDNKGSFNPLVRDRLITGFAMTCRGEFSFIIAAFALGEGLFDAKVYAAIVWAVLFSCVSSPFILLNIIKLFNKKEAAYFASTNPHKSASKDGTIPLYMHITVKSQNIMGLQEKFRSIINDLGLEIIERRTNRHGRGLDAIVQTDIFVRDEKITTKVQKIKAQRKIKRALVAAEAGTAEEKRGSFNRQGSMHVSSKHLSEINLNALDDDEKIILQDAANQEDVIIKRGKEIEKAIVAAIDDSAEVVVQTWNPWSWTDVLKSIAEHYHIQLNRNPETVETFDKVFTSIDADGGGEIDVQEMFTALQEVGIDITEEGVLTLFGIIDEDGNGTVEHHEWNTTVDFFLELEEEEAAMRDHHAKGSLDDEQKKLRANKMKELQVAAGKGPQDKSMDKSGDQMDKSGDQMDKSGDQV